MANWLISDSVWGHGVAFRLLSLHNSPFEADIGVAAKNMREE
jgi:hypothetical protein